MKDYITKTLTTLNELLSAHPDADLRYGTHMSILEHCKFLESDIRYDSDSNTIYIGF